MAFPNSPYIYVYDPERDAVVLVNSETGEQVDREEDPVVPVLKWLHEKGRSGILRKFCVWCANRMNRHIKPIQNRILSLAEQAIEGTVETVELEELYQETEGMAVATDSVGLRQGELGAPAFLASRECINPDPFEGALCAARYHRLWVEMKIARESADGTSVSEMEQAQIDYLLEQIGGSVA